MNSAKKCVLIREKVPVKVFKTFETSEFLPERRFLSDGRQAGKFEIPHCKKAGFIDNLKNLVCWDRARRMHEHVDENHRMLGPVFRMEIGSVQAVFVNSAEGYQRIFKAEGPTPGNFVPEAWRIHSEMRKCPRGLLFMNGEEWLGNRRILNKLLLKPCTAKDVIVSSCENEAIKLCNDWKFYANTRNTVPGLEKKLYLWSIKVIVATLMGTKWEAYEEEFSPDVEVLADNLHQVFVQSAKLSLLPLKQVVKLQLPVWRKFIRVMDTTMSVTRKLVLRMDSLSGDGLLGLMKDARIPGENLVKIVTDMVIAAGDTTTYSTQWALYLLSTHPEVQQKIFTICRGTNSPGLLSDPYIKGVFRESLRLYPTAPFLLRTLPQNIDIGPYTIEKGELILMSLYSSGRDDGNFPDAQKFSPERWLRNSQNKYDNVVNPLGSLPFAAGARSCIGRKLAETQMTLTITQLIKNFTMTCDNADSIRMILHLISVPSSPIELRLTPRNQLTANK